MPTKLSLRLAATILALALAAILATAWRADHRAQAKLAANLAAAQQSLTQLDARQHARDTQLQQTLATLAAEKRAATTPTQIAAALAKQIPLPLPLTFDPNPCQAKSSSAAAPASSSGPHRSTTKSPTPPCSSGPPFGPESLDSTTSPNSIKGARAPSNSYPTQTSTNPSNNPSSPQVTIPTADLQPLYNFTIDCQSCQAKLTAVQADLAGQRAKSAILTRERDEAVRVAKGGSLLRRLAHNAKWLALGAAAGALAAKSHH